MAEKMKTRTATGRAQPVVRRGAAAAPASADRIMIGGAHDPEEMAADRIADRVMRMAAPAPIVRRKGAACEAEDKQALRRSPEADRQVLSRPKTRDATVPLRRAANTATIAPGTAAAPAWPSAAGAIGALGSGQLLAPVERAFFEPRFGADLSSIGVHDGPRADRARRSVGARAFTRGHDIALARGENGSGTATSRRLMAHELAHAVHRTSGDNRTIRRRVDPTLMNCPPSRTGVPADAFERLRAADNYAWFGLRELVVPYLRSAADALSRGDETYANDFLNMFGPPASAPGGRFRNRIGPAAVYPRWQDASAEEIREMARRYERMATHLAQPIRYVCWGPSRLCSDTYAATQLGSTRIWICQPFWGLGPQEQGATIIHEAAHAALRIGRGDSHPTTPLVARFRNAFYYECLADIIIRNVLFPYAAGRCPTSMAFANFIGPDGAGGGGGAEAP